MSVRSRCLPPGWYPGTEAQTRKKIEQFLSSLPEVNELHRSSGVAGIVPHAGWEYSGKIALDVLRRLDEGLHTIVVVGGHLSPRDGLYAAPEEEFETPLGNLRVDAQMLSALKSCVPLQMDRFPDNTVEVQLPFLRYLFPEAMVLYLRAAPNSEALRLGEAVRRIASSLERRTAVIGSTDLTHYGEAYGFAPRGGGEDAVAWVKEENDRRVIDAFLRMEGERALDLGRSERSACSAGGAAAAIAFAAASDVRKGALVRYTTSWDVAPAPSFVGYAGILFAREPE